MERTCMPDKKMIITEQDEFRTVVKYLEDAEKEEQERKEQKERSSEKKETEQVGIANWFVTICYLNIPVFNVLYILFLLIRKSTPKTKKCYVLAFALYHLLVLLLAAMLIYGAVEIGADFVDNLLKYIQ